MTVLARRFFRCFGCLLPLALVACSLARKPEPPASPPAPRPAVVAEPAPVATQAPLQAEALPPARPLPPAAAPTAKKPVPVPPVVRDVGCRSQRSGKGDDEKTTISCTNNSKIAQTVFLRIHAIGVSGIPTLASEKSGSRLGPGETRTLATLSVISRPSSVNFSYSSKPAP
ncbi:MAG: hypothetical protein V4562_09915 [Pseudomonadota bacterium]